jgi:4-diphosphocytidyl-2-C-methyl-D-erythritol kinase
MINDLEQVVLPRFPEVGKIKDLLMDSGAAAAMMTGSGPTVFGVFNNQEDAVQARGYVQANGGGEWTVFHTKTQ